ncbi:hypothetical protein CONCODRAFT_78984 [Conidiobolus coronatus NRRL 28638]|uniref:Methanethiol oxidase n=1 Tax=Conidiobolus coronatus (strain ATCC 28846 / CBS 209.66 / NRRL 28638) TaxID=796925 RepID=A0A137P571_CONC2|nr:hypothetical protein CONCODRAFT_78984 [Conidiobolus coronatus NRRL 28638]|eukprot:KXN70157.1 hypothetical protein CONCODRAFT_78984 [Conidiobolus coronatus NRRL 28638]
MIYKSLIFSLFIGSLTVQASATPSYDQAGNTKRCKVLIRENNLPEAVQTHELVRVPDSKMILISQLSSSTLVKANVKARGVISDSKAHLIGTPDSALHGLAVSALNKGMVWLTLEGDNKLHLIDPKKDDINTPPVILKTIDIPAPGAGPHYVGEYGNDLWVSLKKSGHALRINQFNSSDYDLFKAVPNPIFVAQHPESKLFYSSQDMSSKILKIDPATKITKQIEIPSDIGATPVGLISGANNGIWFVLLGSTTNGTGTFGYLDKDDNIKYFKLSSELAKNASLLHLAFDANIKKNPGLWILSSSIIKKDALDMVIRVDMDPTWSNITKEEVMVLPTQRNAAHRLLPYNDQMFATELATSKIAALKYECDK